MKRLFVILSCFLALSCFAQTSKHSIYLGTNLSGIHLDLSSSGVAGLKNKDFAHAKIGFNAGYRYLISLSDKLVIGTGLDFKNINCKFQRPYYNFPNDLNPNLTSVEEKLKFFRFSVPLQVSYDLVSKKTHSFYVLVRTDINFTNNMDRTADYKIQTPPTGYTSKQFKGKQKVTFDGNSFGFGFVTAIGSKIKINDKPFFIELSYYGDISKNKISTLHNIEYDNYYFGKLKGLQMKIGHIFSFSSKKK